MIESNHVVLWNRCLEVIKDNVPETTYNTWFAPIVPLKYEDKTLIVQSRASFSMKYWKRNSWICCERHCTKLLAKAPS